jgi:hypothetical protein
MSYVSNGWLGEMQNVSAEIDETFGEGVRIITTERRPNFEPKPSPENAVDVLAVFSWRSKLIFKPNSGTAMQTQEGLIETRVPIFSFSRDSLPWAPRQGDVIERLCSGEQFEVKNVEPDGISRITCPCVELGRQSP